MKIKKGDTVIVITGKDKGKEGAVVRAFPKRSEVIVAGVNMMYRHKKSNRRGSQGQIVHKPAAMPVANVAYKSSKGKPTRVGYTVEGTGAKRHKVRIERSTKNKI